MPRMSLTLFTLPRITVTHPPVLQVWFIFTTTNHSKGNAGSSPRGSPQPPAFEIWQNPLRKGPSHCSEAFTPKLSCSLQRSCSSSITGLLLSHKFPGRQSWEHGMHIWQGLDEKPTDFLPQAGSTVKSQWFFFPLAPTLTRTKTRAFQPALQHLQHSASLPKPPDLNAVHLW